MSRNTAITLQTRQELLRISEDLYRAKPAGAKSLVTAALLRALTHDAIAAHRLRAVLLQLLAARALKQQLDQCERIEPEGCLARRREYEDMKAGAWAAATELLGPVTCSAPEPRGQQCYLGDGGVLEGTNRTTSGAIGQP